MKGDRNLRKGPGGFRVRGRDLASLFANCGRTVEGLMVDATQVRKAQTRNINLQAKDLNELLQKFLSDLIYLRDTYQLLFSGFELVVNPEVVSLSGKLKGEQLEKSRHRVRSDFKAAKLRRPTIIKTARGWEVEVAFES